MRSSDLPHLPTGFLSRLAKLLGMVGSNQDGEALNAARLADNLVRQHGITWHVVMV